MPHDPFLTCILMPLADLIGWAAVIITLAYTLLGLPTQILKNRRSQSTGGLSLFMIVLLFITFLLWVAYGVVRSDIFIIIPNTAGTICVAVLLSQFWIYRNTEA